MKIGDFSINPNDIYLVGNAELEEKGLVNHHIASANNLYEIGISQIITQVFNGVSQEITKLKKPITEDEKNIENIRIEIKFQNVTIEKPITINKAGGDEPIFPNKALVCNQTYESDLYVDVIIVATAIMANGVQKVRDDKISHFKLCRIPVMVGSYLCNTYGLSKKVLIDLNEDPMNPGGYFIINGIEWVIDCAESILFNKIRIHHNEGYAKEVVRAEFISKPGDYYLNSDEFLIRILNDGQITIEINRNLFKEKQFPFYIIFRILGWGSDKEIYNNVLDEQDIIINNKMNIFLDNAFKAKYSFMKDGQFIYTQAELIRLLAEEMRADYKKVDYNNTKNVQILMQSLINQIDLYLLPHIGTTKEARPHKMRFLALVINKMFKVRMKIIPPTDRDSYNSKRIHAAGTSYAKSFKTYFNAAIVQSIKRKFAKEFRAQSFFEIDLSMCLTTAIYGDEFTKMITRAIISGNKSIINIGSKSRKNNLSSQQLHRKNQINVYGVLRQVSATSSDSSQQSERASEMRRVHMSFLGYICTIYSPEGKRVGVNKQLAIFASITQAMSSETIRNIVIKDIIPLNDVKDNNHDLSKVFINGYWLGFVDDALNLINKYRQDRRAGKLPPEITIVWDDIEDDVYIWTDVGRIIRPLLIVYNNIRDADKFPANERYSKTKKFKQGLALTQAHINGLYNHDITIQDLLKDNIIEYISAEEQENYFISSSFDKLNNDKNNIYNQYTHCDIEQAIVGLSALTSPFSHHNQTPRVIYQVLQAKQTCSIYTLNWAFRSDKDVFLQYQCDNPIIKTVANKYIFPNGSNIMIAMMCNTSYNIEDAIIINKGAIDRGLFAGSRFTYEEVVLEAREKIILPDTETTLRIRLANYDKLVNGVVPIGTYIEKNDVLIARIVPLSKTENSKYLFKDISFVYRENEPAVVHNVIRDKNGEDKEFCKVILRKDRPVMTGNKFCLTPDHDVLTTDGWKPIDRITIYDTVATLNPDNNVVEWRHPIETYNFDYDGQMYYVENDQVSIMATLNHKMYVNVINSTDLSNDKFQLIDALNLLDNDVYFKNDGINNIKDIENIQLPEYHEYKRRDVNMSVFLTFLGIYLINGNIYDEYIVFKMKSSRVLLKMLKSLKCEYNEDLLDDGSYFITIKDKQLCNYLSEFGNILRRLLPWCFQLSIFQSWNILYGMSSSANYIHLKNHELLDDIQILAFNCGYSIVSNIIENDVIEIELCSNKIDKINRDLLVKKEDSVIKKYNGSVYCINVPNHIFMVRKNNKHVWTGNSSRAGQKGCISLILDDADMPFIAGTNQRPTMVINPHAIPTRMTIGQIYESIAGLLCAMKGCTMDGTMFRKINISAICNELEDIGLNRYGNHKMINGLTGERIDAEIFMGVVTYQRLQKFTQDAVYSIERGSTDILTHQLLSGKSSGGGLRIGEINFGLCGIVIYCKYVL